MYLKGVFAKNERGYRLAAKNKRFWLLLILLLTVASLRRKLLKTIIPKNVVSIQIQKDATFNSDRKQINLIPNKLFRYCKQLSFIIFRRIRKKLILHNILYFSWSESYFWKHLFLFRGFLIMKTTFLYFPGMFENIAPAKII